MKYLNSIVIFVATAALVLPITTCGGPETEVEEQIRPVRYAKVFTVGGGRVRTFSGSAKAGIESRLSFKVAGTISNLAVQVGQEVNPEDVIAELDPEDYRLNKERVEESLKRAKVEARNAGRNFEDIRQLFERNRVSRTDFENARTAAEAADKAVAAIEKELALANRQLDYTKLTAPAKGVISAVSVEVSENVSAGKTVVNLIRDSVPEVTVSVPEAFISFVERGSPVVISFDAIQDRTFNGTVTEVGVTIGQRLATYPVTVQLDEKSSEIRSGMVAEVTFSLQSFGVEERILVPPVAVGEDRQGRFVYVVKPTGAEDLGVVNRRAVRIGELTVGGLEIIEGLTDGELVVTAGISHIHDGLTVELQETKDK